MTEFTAIGMGIGFATNDYIKEFLEKQKLFELKLKEKIPCRYISIALSENHLPNFSTKRLVEIIIKK